ncbi:hypothetical protein [Streptacidiphilus jiangxiensis]|uniref:Mycothiol maleylpyruvate isomerase N-terminal domain-containing protein n=1 Tax=Streptacidiphilus jiangxiensis TaxID=235985 RepID=A0A1H7TRP7_STRJI|nr:hypothetical protein [Streptacidiphilus jiangxiensis]SEL87582.1 hypothetical protein SAMN05414137_114172 [Streptacidiphilus jiangxiensis]
MTSTDLLPPIGPVTTDDLAEGLRLVVALLRQPTALSADWSRPAGTLDMDCWETAEHLADCFFFYGTQLAQQSPPVEDFLSFVNHQSAPGKPWSVISSERESGVEGLVQVVEACGALHIAMVRTSAPEARAFHSMGTTDPEGSAAMGLVELFVHGYDLSCGLGLDWTAPAGLAARALHRLFPDAPADTDPWETLLWATGRGDLPGRERLTADWRWHSAPR